MAESTEPEIIVRAFQFNNRVVLEEIELVDQRHAHIKTTVFEMPRLVGVLEAVETLDLFEEAS